MLSTPEPILSALRQSEGYRELRMWNEAWDVLDDLESHLHCHPYVMIARAQILGGQGEWVKAGYIADQLTNTCPDFADGWFWQACTQAQKGQIDEAKASAKRAIELDENHRLRVLDDPFLGPMWATI